MTLIKLFTALLFLCSFLPSNGQIDSTKFKIIEGLTDDILENYVSYDKAKQMTDFVNQKFIAGSYDTALNIHEFMYEITRDLRSISKDEHIFVMDSHHKKHFAYKSKNSSSKKFKIVNQERRRNIHSSRTLKDKFSYGQIKILPGNIGYFEIYDFKNASIRRKENNGRIKFISVMKFLKNTNSIIIDLRANTGGYIFLANYFASFFIDKPNTYFITTEAKWARPNGRDTVLRKDFYTPEQNNFKYAKGKNIYILTSNATFSAAELATYALKKLSKVEIIGEKTRGGGNGHFGGYSTAYYSAIVPGIKVFDKELDYSIETKGITPDTSVKADGALKVACIRASQKATQDTLMTKTKYFKGRDETKVVYARAFMQYLPDYIGNYRRVKITLEHEKLYFYYDNSPKQILIPRSKDIFKTEHFKSIKFLRSKEDKVTSIQIKWFDGLVETYRLL